MSGKQVPATVDSGACGGKKSVEDLNLPVVKSLVGDKTVNVLRDTSCEGVVVSRRLVEDSQLTGKCCLNVRIDNTVLRAEKAKIHVKTRYLSGNVEALCIPEVTCDLVVGNVPGARNPDDPDMSVMVGCCDDQGTGKTRGCAEAVGGAGCCEPYRSGLSLADSTPIRGLYHQKNGGSYDADSSCGKDVII